MNEGTSIPTTQLPADELFDTRSWKTMLREAGPGFIAEARSLMRFDYETLAYILHIQCIRINKENEIEKFLNWIDPYVDASRGEYIGFMYQQDSDGKTPLFKEA